MNRPSCRVPLQDEDTWSLGIARIVLDNFSFRHSGDDFYSKDPILRQLVISMLGYSDLP